MPRYYVYDLFRKGDEISTFRKECEKSVSSEFCNSLFVSKEREIEKPKAKIFLVPIFESTSKNRDSLVKAINRLKGDQQFLKFRGSDFVFVCYLRHCERVLRDLLLALGDANRSLWVARKDAKTWNCMDRMISIDEVPTTRRVLQTQDSLETQKLNRILHEANAKINGRNRWTCANREHWNVNTMMKVSFKGMRALALKSPKDKVIYCGVPKVASSIAVLMMRRMNGMKDWKQANTNEIRNFDTGYEWRCTNLSDTLSLFNRTDWVKGMLVRDPISRLLSGYRSKIVDLSQFSRVPGGWNDTKPPSFEEFIDRLTQLNSLDELDPHFRSQSSLCGVRKLPYDFVGHYEHREEDVKGFLQSLELWKTIGESGWGLDGHKAIYSQDEQIIRKSKLKPVTHADSKSTLQKYYTRDLVKTVMKLYHEDFDRFGFSKNVDDYF